MATKLDNEVSPAKQKSTAHHLITYLCNSKKKNLLELFPCPLS